MKDEVRAKTNKLIDNHKDTLDKYERLLRIAPGNLICTAMVKNTKELIEELKLNLA